MDPQPNILTPILSPSPLRKLIPDLPAPQVQVGDTVLEDGVLRTIARIEEVLVHPFGGVYCPISSYALTFEPDARCRGTGARLNPRARVSVWRLCD